MDIIQVEGLAKWYGHIEAVRDVSFTVRQGEIFGFLGRFLKNQADRAPHLTPLPQHVEPIDRGPTGSGAEQSTVELVPLLVVLSLSLAGLGLLVASRMRSQQGFQMVMQLLIFPLMFLSGVFFPVNSVPTWLQVIGKVNPVTYGVDAIRQLFLGNGTAVGGDLPGSSGSALGVSVFGHTLGILEDVLVLGLIGVVFMALAVWSFSRTE